jgi:hypothetical protein
VYDVDDPEEGVEQVWLVNEDTERDYSKYVDWVWFVDASLKNDPRVKLVYVAGYDSWWIQEWVSVGWSNLPRKLRRRP